MRPAADSLTPTRTSALAFKCGSSSRFHLGGLGALCFGFETRDDGVEALLLNLGTVVFAIALHVADAVDDHVPGLPLTIDLAQAVVHAHLGAVRAFDLCAHGGAFVGGRD